MATKQVMTPTDPTLTPDIIVEGYERAYRRIHGREPQIRHIGGQWYYVAGETVHRITLLAEIMRLRELAHRENPYEAPNRSMIQRLIARLRGI